MIGRRPTGGLRNLIGNGPDGRREEDEILDGGDGFVVDNEYTKKIRIKNKYKNIFLSYRFDFHHY